MLPLFLDIDQVLRTHRSLINHYGGTGQVRDVALLHSAIAMPQASFGGEFLHADLFEMAAAYLYHIVQNHPFLDGNKRTGAATAPPASSASANERGVPGMRPATFPSRFASAARCTGGPRSWPPGSMPGAPTGTPGRSCANERLLSVPVEPHSSCFGARSFWRQT
jgi:hypothetical protein